MTAPRVVTPWEYQVIRLPADWLRHLNLGDEPDHHILAEDVLNRLGAEGWELVAFAVGGSYNGIALLKRPRREGR